MLKQSENFMVVLVTHKNVGDLIKSEGARVVTSLLLIFQTLQGS